MSKLERLNARVAKLLTMAVHEVLGEVKETVSEYQEKTVRTQRENESLKTRLRELQDKLRTYNAGENPPLLGSSNTPSQDKPTKDEIEEVDPTGSSSESKFSLTPQKEMREEEMIFITVCDTVDCSVSPGLVTEDLSNVTNTDLTGHVAYWLLGEQHDVSVRHASESPLCSQKPPPIKAEPEPGYLCSSDQVEQGDTFNCGGVASGVSQRGCSPNNTESSDMADTEQYSDQWKQELDPANQGAASFPLGSIGAVSCETPRRRSSRQTSKSEPLIQNYTDEEEPLDWGGSKRQVGPTSNEPAEPEPSEPYSQLGSRKVHQHQHIGVKRHVCGECGKCFSHLGNLKVHQRQHTGEKPYGCTQCDKHFTRLRSLEIHQRNHANEGPYGCTHCGKRFSSQYILTNHQRKHTGEKPYGCTQCDKYFSHLSTLKVHQRQHTVLKPYVCGECGKCFRSLANLNVHKRRQHTSDRPRCLECGKSFSSASYLKVHQRCHTGEKPYTCDLCGKHYRFPAEFKRHQLIHL